MDWFRFKACLKCHGDLVFDEGDWLCLQCGTYYYTGLYRRPNRSQPQDHYRPGPPCREKDAALGQLQATFPFPGTSSSTILGALPSGAAGDVTHRENFASESYVTGFGPTISA